MASKNFLSILRGSIFLALVITGSIRLASLMSLDEPSLVSFVPDDLFYYTESASNRIHEGWWSASGYEQTSGIHLLWAHLHALIELLFDGPSLSVVISVTGIVTLVAFSAFASVLAVRIFQETGFLGAALFAPIAFSPLAMRQIDLGMEGLFTASLAGMSVILAMRNHVTRPMTLIVVGLSFGAALSRIDVGVVLMLWFILLSLAASPSRRRLAFMGVIGVAGGLFSTLLWQFVQFGRFVSASAEIKARLSLDQTRIVDTRPLSWMITDHLIRAVDTPALFAVIYLLVLLSLFTWAVIVRIAEVRLASGFALLLLGPLLVNPAINLWYGGMAVVAMMFSAYAVALTFRGPVQWSRQQLLPQLFIAVSILATVAQIETSPRKPPWPHHASMLDAVETVALPVEAVVGTWNSGISHRFGHRRTINLDGLANDDAAVAIAAGDLAGYLDVVGVNVLFDWGRMFEHYIPITYGQSTANQIAAAFPHSTTCSSDARLALWEKSRIEIRSRELHLIENVLC